MCLLAPEPNFPFQCSHAKALCVPLTTGFNLLPQAPKLGPVNHRLHGIPIKEQLSCWRKKSKGQHLFVLGFDHTFIFRNNVRSPSRTFRIVIGHINYSICLEIWSCSRRQWARTQMWNTMLNALGSYNIDALPQVLVWSAFGGQCPFWVPH